MGVPILGENDLPSAERQLPGDGPQIRLLFCFNCKSLEELPDFEGNPRDDYLLEILIERHESAGVKHAGQLMKVPLQLWSVETVKEEITKQIYAKGAPGFDALMPGFYDTKATFAEDAMACWKQHLQPKGQCPDYGSEKKRLIPNTVKERKELGLSPATEGGPRIFLCQFCPVHVYNVRKQREAAGF